MQVIGYCRVSTEAQAEDDRNGLEAQKRIITEYCQSHDMEIMDWYIDKVSGVSEDREAFNEILNCDIPVKACVVAKYDRVARDIRLYYYFSMVLQRKGIELVSASEQVPDDETGLGEIYKSLMLFVAEQERKNISARTSAGRIAKASKGGYAGGGAPLGYKVFNKKLVVDQEEAKEVRHIFKLRDKGMTYEEIIAKLKEEGYKTKRGNNFNLATLCALINRRKFYEGYYSYSNSGWVKGQHEAILEEQV